MTFEFKNKTRISDQGKADFYGHFSWLLEVGLKMNKALELLAQETSNRAVKINIQEMRSAVVGGRELSEVMKGHGMFSDFEVYSVSAGERSGKLPEILKKLSEYFGQRVKFRKELIKTLSYPLLVLTISIVVVGVMLTYIVPSFSSLFGRFGGELPFATKILLFIQQSVSHWVWYLCLISTLIFLAIKILRNKSAQIRLKIDTYIQRLFLVGNMITAISLLRYFTLMHVLISNGVTLQHAMRLSSAALGNLYIRNKMKQAETAVVQGISYNKSLQKAGLLKPAILALIASGEETNQLARVFLNISQKLHDDQKDLENLLSTYLEPVLVILTGSIIAFILIALYLPIFQMGSFIK